MSRVTVDLALGTLEGCTHEIPAMFLPANASDDDRRLLDRWRTTVHQQNGYTAVGHDEEGRET